MPVSKSNHVGLEYVLNCVADCYMSGWMMKVSKLALVCPLLFAFCLPMMAQWRQQPTTGSTPMTVADRTKQAGMSGTGPQLEAKLVDEHKNTEQKQAVVKVEVWGVDLISAPQAGVDAKRGEAYLSYKLDQQAEIKTANKEQTFRDLSPGEHQVTVQLAYADGRPAGAPMVLKLKIK